MGLLFWNSYLNNMAKKKTVHKVTILDHHACLPVVITAHGCLTCVQTNTTRALWVYKHTSMHDTACAVLVGEDRVYVNESTI